MNGYVNEPGIETRENVLAGVVGAFIFSLAGGVVYFLLYLVGYVASISGLVGAICAVKGYSIFAKKESKKGIVIAAVMSLIAIAAAWYFSLSYEIYEAAKTLFKTGDIDYTLSLFESVRVTPEFLKDPDVAKEAYGNLALGLFFCLIGCGSYVFAKLKNSGKAKADDPAAPFSQTTPNDFDKT